MKLNKALRRWRNGRGCAHRRMTNKSRRLGVDFEARARADRANGQAKCFVAICMQRPVWVVASLNQPTAKQQDRCVAAHRDAERGTSVAAA